MIDWLTFRVAMWHSEPILGGHVLSIDPSGELEWKSAKRVTVDGSWQTGLQVKTYNHPAFGDLQFVEISGNPVKYFQGHNLWGTNDVPSLVVATCEAVAAALGLDVPSHLPSVRTGAGVSSSRGKPSTSASIPGVGP